VEHPIASRPVLVLFSSAQSQFFGPGAALPSVRDASHLSDGPRAPPPSKFGRPSLSLPVPPDLDGPRQKGDEALVCSNPDKRHHPLGYGATRSDPLEKEKTVAAVRRTHSADTGLLGPQRSGSFERRWGVSTANRMEWCDDIVDDGRRFDLHGPPRFWFVGGKAAKDERDRAYGRSVAGASEADERLSESDQRRHFGNPEIDGRAYLRRCVAWRAKAAGRQGSRRANWSDAHFGLSSQGEI
jgi:hypothetical protein